MLDQSTYTGRFGNGAGLGFLGIFAFLPYIIIIVLIVVIIVYWRKAKKLQEEITQLKLKLDSRQDHSPKAPE
ncbi:MAG TPA: hypothetical protein VKK79_20035 [Candidatus Lokiarchaeia archaeon]|nr:hypothetical protein [Candidatus Lokiarchaeia archaeon]